MLNAALSSQARLCQTETLYGKMSSSTYNKTISLFPCLLPVSIGVDAAFFVKGVTSNCLP